MCFQIQNPIILEWLKAQVRVLETWREQVALQPEIDLKMVMRLERHYQWLTGEVATLEEQENRTHNHLRAVS